MKTLTQEQLNEMLDNEITTFENVILDGLSLDPRRDWIKSMVNEDRVEGFNFHNAVIRNMHLDLSIMGYLSKFTGTSIENCEIEDDGISDCEFTDAVIRNSRFVLADYVKQLCNIKTVEDAKRGLMQWSYQDDFKAFEGSSFVGATIIQTSFDMGVGRHDYTDATIIDSSFTNGYYRISSFYGATLTDVTIKDCEFYTIYGAEESEPSLTWTHVTSKNVIVENVILNDVNEKRQVEVNGSSDALRNAIKLEIENSMVMTLIRGLEHQREQSKQRITNEYNESST